MDPSNQSLNSLQLNFLNFQYPTKMRTAINYNENLLHLKSSEIPVLKYNYTIDKYLNMDHFFSTLRLSEDGKQMLIYNLKPDGYQ